MLNSSWLPVVTTDPRALIPGVVVLTLVSRPNEPQPVPWASIAAWTLRNMCFRVWVTSQETTGYHLIRSGGTCWNQPLLMLQNNFDNCNAILTGNSVKGMSNQNVYFVLFNLILTPVWIQQWKYIIYCRWDICISMRDVQMFSNQHIWLSSAKRKE